MNLHPARFEGENFRTYKLRRAAENEAVINYLKGSIASYNSSRPKLGKAATKRRKRERMAIIKSKQGAK